MDKNRKATAIETFAYDLNGNWTPHDGRVHDDANQLIEDSNYIYTYDEEGCLLRKESRSDSSDVVVYEWNVLNQLVSVESPSMTAIFTYDALGRRIGKTVDGVETRYLYDGQNVRLESEGGVSWTHAMTSSGIDQWLCREDLETGEQLFYHTDDANSTIAVTDGSGAVVERYIYSSYGELEAFSEDLQTRHDRPIQPYTFTGREYEPDAQLYYYRARFYDPAMGRFISNDPAGTADGLNLYTYAANNPFRFTDPSGLRKEDEYHGGWEQTDDSKLTSAPKKGLVVAVYDPNEKGAYNHLSNWNYANTEAFLESISTLHTDHKIPAVDTNSIIDYLIDHDIPLGSVDRMYIFDHGVKEIKNGKISYYQSLGSTSNRFTITGKLVRYFSSSGDLVLTGCEVGRDGPYLESLSKKLKGRKVWAYSDYVEHGKTFVFDENGWNSWPRY